MNFEKADRLPLIEVESYESEILKRWKREGLSENESYVYYIELLKTIV